MAQGGIAAAPPAAGFAVGGVLTIHAPAPLVDVPGPFAASPELLLDWAAEAPEGARCVYARCESMARHARLREALDRLAAEGAISLQGARRWAADSALFDHIAKRTCASVVSVAAPSAPTPAALLPGLEAVFNAILAAARGGRRCPSDFELARLAGLPTRNAAAWRVRVLEKEGRIAMALHEGPEGPWRVATVEGKRTLDPPLSRRSSGAHGEPRRGTSGGRSGDDSKIGGKHG